MPTQSKQAHLCIVFQSSPILLSWLGLFASLILLLPPPLLPLCIPCLPLLLKLLHLCFLLRSQVHLSSGPLLPRRWTEQVLALVLVPSVVALHRGHVQYIRRYGQLAKQSGLMSSIVKSYSFTINVYMYIQCNDLNLVRIYKSQPTYKHTTCGSHACVTVVCATKCGLFVQHHYRSWICGSEGSSGLGSEGSSGLGTRCVYTLPHTVHYSYTTKV